MSLILGDHPALVVAPSDRSALPITTNDHPAMPLALSDRDWLPMRLGDHPRMVLALSDAVSFSEDSPVTSDVLAWQVHDRDPLEAADPLSIEVFTY
jgi:hypothetical protein